MKVLGENAVTRPIPHGLPLDAAPLRLYASLLDDNYFIFRARGKKKGVVGEWFLFRRIIFILSPLFFLRFYVCFFALEILEITFNV